MTPRKLYDAAVLGRWRASVPIANPPRVVIRDRGGEVQWPAMPTPNGDTIGTRVDILLVS